MRLLLWRLKAQNQTKKWAIPSQEFSHAKIDGESFCYVVHMIACLHGDWPAYEF